MSLQESGEMYLETMLVLSDKLGKFRSVDVAETMGFSKPSVSRAIGILKSGGYITVDSSGYIELSDCGREVAEKIYARHNLLTEFLTSLGVEKTVAVDDACKMEHDISDETFDAIRQYMKKL